MTAYNSEPIVIDLESGQAADFIFKMPDSHGESIAIHAIPELQDFNTEVEDISITGGPGNNTLLKYPVSSSMNITVKFRLIVAKEMPPVLHEEPEPDYSGWIEW